MRTAPHRVPWPQITLEDELRCGAFVGSNYLLGDVLGVGGMGIVYAGVQRSLRRPVAVKMPRTELSSHEAVRRRFHTAAVVASRFSHRNVVAVIDYGSSAGVPYLVMERVDGSLLGEMVRRDGPLAPRLAIEIVAQVLDALAGAHHVKVVHADVKADNVFLEAGGDAPFVRLFDFGVARICDADDASEPGVLYGTPDYIAPELIRGQRPSPASDIYAAGIMLYELLTGATPFGGGQSHEVLARHLQMEVTAPSRVRGDDTISPELDAIVLRALDKSAAKRIPTAKRFAQELRALLQLGGRARHADLEQAVSVLRQLLARLDS